MIRYIIIFGYLILIAAVGAMFRKQKTTENFFLAGRNVHWLPIALSYVASLTSAISFMWCPMWTYQNAMIPAFNEIFVVLFALPVLVLIFLPLYVRIGSVSIYEYLELRFSLAIRLMGSSLFILNRFMWMGLVIYTPSMVLNYLTGIPIWKLILIMGPLTTVYTCLGGMKAVIWTDVIQFAIFFLGIIAVYYIVSIDTAGGFFGVIKSGIELDKIKFFRWTWDFKQPNTVIYAFAAIYGFANYAGDQVVIQRFLSARSLKETIKSFYFSCGINFVMIFMMFLVGAFLFVFFANNPTALPADIKVEYIFPHFIKDQMPIVFGSFLIAAIMAASMSSIDSGLNSVSAVIVTDFVKRLKKRVRDDAYYLKLSRILTLVLGGAITIIGLIVNLFDDVSFLNKILVTAGWFAPPISAVFLLGAITKTVNSKGAMITFVLNPTIMILVSKLGIVPWLSKADRIFLPGWLFMTISMTLALLIGYFSSKLFEKPAKEKLEYNIWGNKLKSEEQSDEKELVGKQ